MKHILKLPANAKSIGTYTPKIAIVDDDEAHLQFIRLIMAREAYNTEVFLFNDPEKGLAYLKENPVDLVLLDVMMPGMTGFQLLEKLREDQLTAELPVIFLTSTQDTEHVVRAFEAGAVDYIAKPINSAILTARIGGVLHRKYLENELRLQNQELERLNRFKDELVSVISHDLRSPLAAIEVICQNWKEQQETSGTDTPKSGRIDRIINQSRLARRLVENFLDYDKMEQGRLVPEPTFFPIEELIHSCAEDEHPLLQDRNLELEIKLPEEQLLLFADREMLAQAIRNVLGNAIKFASQRITFQITADKLSNQSGGILRMVISDDGVGIPEEKIAFIFDKYTKADSGASGTGLGLFITRQVVQLHHGWITASSRPGQETIFTMEIPLLYRPEDLPDMEDLAQEPVAILSPDRHTATLLEGILSEAGMLGVSTIVGTEMDIEVLQKSHPRLIVADLQQESTQLSSLSQIIHQLDPEIGWLLHGPEQLMEDFLKTSAEPHPFLTTPVDPLRFLRMAAMLLRGEVPDDATKLS